MQQKRYNVYGKRKEGDFVILPSSSRIRSIVAECSTESDIAITLRKHKIKFAYTTETGFLSIRIPCRKGCIRVFRTCSRSVPFTIRQENPIPFRYTPVPVVRNID